MAEKKKKQPAEFAKDKSAFAGGSSIKGSSAAKRAERKQSGAHRPRDADVTSGHDVQKSEQKETFGYSTNDSKKQNGLKSGKKPYDSSAWNTYSGFPSVLRKTAGKNSRLNQKKRRQSGGFQTENNFRQKKEKPDNNKADIKTQSGFSQEQNIFVEAKRKQPDAHELREEYAASGHDVQKSEKQKTFGHNAGDSPKQNCLKPGNKQDDDNGNGAQDNHSSFQNRAGKTAKKNIKHNQKKHRQSGKFQTGNSITGNKEKLNGSDTGSKTQRDFLQEQNAFTEEGGEEQTEEAKERRDNYRHRDDYRQREKKGGYHRCKHQDRDYKKTAGFQRDFQTKESAFKQRSPFTEGAEPGFQGSKRLDRLQKKAEKAGKKTEAARRKLSKKKEYSLERVFDEKTGRAKYALTAVEKEKPFKEGSVVRKIAGRAGSEFKNYAHGRIAEAEKENSAVEGAHRTEQKAEDVYRFVKRHYKSKKQRQREKAAKLEKKQVQKEAGFHYQKFLEENPEIREKTLKKQRQKRLQKQRIKREYAKAGRAGKTAENTKEAAVKSADFTTTVAKKLQETAAKHASLLVTAGVFALLLIMVTTSISSCGTMFSEVMSTALAGSYMSAPEEIDAADLIFSELEMELQKKIHSIETDYPNYDEYRYSLDEIGHDPFAFISYLSAVYTEFTAADVRGEIESLFDEMYKLTLNPVQETRTRTVTKTGIRTVTDPVTGEETEEKYEYEEEEEYTVAILETILTTTDLNAVVAEHMSSEQKEIYTLYNETHGLTQRFYMPLNLYWYNYVSCYYGYRINPVTKAEQLHRGVDIAVPTGTAVFAAMDGTVTTAAYNSYYEMVKLFCNTYKEKF